ncbi:MAG TPA: hypothetical protein VN231_06120 [Allosphingosinicella sp.]|nr:hypothetical protein [Allosphingosinicella sp.]
MEPHQALGSAAAAIGLPVAPALPPVAPTSHLADPRAFFDHMRRTDTLGPELTRDEVDGCNAILEACGEAGWPIADTAYALATAYHETAGTMKPIREYGRGRGRRYGVPGPHGGQIAFGRGYVQLTWPENYEKADRRLGLGGTLIANYDRALEPEIAAAIMVRGMREGWFTSRDLDDDLPRDGLARFDQFVRSRDIINGTDKAEKIAREAMDFQAGLAAGGWR